MDCTLEPLKDPTDLECFFPLSPLRKALRLILYLGAGSTLLSAPAIQALECPVTSATEITADDSNAGTCTIESTGSVNITTGTLSNLSGAQLDNLGSLNTQPTGNLLNQVGAGMDNLGTLTNHSGGYTVVAGTHGSYGVLSGNRLLNSGTLTNQSSATLTNSDGGLFINDGTLHNSGTLNNQGGNRVVTQRARGFSFNGIIDYWGDPYFDTRYDASAWETASGIVNHGQLYNQSGSTFSNQATGLLENVGQFHNNGTLTNQGGTLSLESDCSQAMLLTPDGLHGFHESVDPTREFHCDWEVQQGIRNLGTISNSLGSQITNEANGVLANYATLQNAGTITNHGRLVNEGDFTNENGGLLINEAGSLFLNSRVRRIADSTGTLHSRNFTGNFINDGTLDNRGTIAYTGVAAFTNNNTLINRTGGRIEDTITNNGSLTNEGYIKSINSGYSTTSIISNHGSIMRLKSQGLVNNYADINIHFGVYENNEHTRFVEARTGSTINNWGNIGRLKADAGSIVYNHGTLSRGAYIQGGTLQNHGVINSDSATEFKSLLRCYNNPPACWRSTYSYNAAQRISVSNNGTLNNHNNIYIADNSEMLIRQTGVVNNYNSISNLGSTIRIDSGGTLLGSGHLTLQDAYNPSRQSIDESRLEVNGSLSQNRITLADRSLLMGTGRITSPYEIHAQQQTTINPGVLSIQRFYDPYGYYSFSPYDSRAPQLPTYGTLSFIDTDLRLSGELVIDVAGLSTYDTLAIFGTIHFEVGSQVVFDFHNYTPSAGDAFTFVTAEQVTGEENLQYAILGLDTNALNLFPHLQFMPGEDLRLLFSESAVIPLPASLWLFGSGLLGLWGAGLRHRRVIM